MTRTRHSAAGSSRPRTPSTTWSAARPIATDRPLRSTGCASIRSDTTRRWWKPSETSQVAGCRPGCRLPGVLDSVLVANRGEIARRVIATARKLGIRSVAVYSEADAGLPFVREADEAVLIGPPQPVASYLNGAAIIAAARQTGAQAVHPGYGFLAENASFAASVIGAGLL